MAPSWGTCKRNCKKDVPQGPQLSCMLGLLPSGFTDPSAALQEEHMACLRQEGLHHTAMGFSSVCTNTCNLLAWTRRMLPPFFQLELTFQFVPSATSHQTEELILVRKAWLQVLVWKQSMWWPRGDGSACFLLLSAPSACCLGQDTSQGTWFPVISADHPQDGTTLACCIFTLPGSLVSPPSCHLKAGMLFTKSSGFVEWYFEMFSFFFKCSFIHDKYVAMWGGSFLLRISLGVYPVSKMLDTNLCLGMLYVIRNLHFQVGEVISVVNLISLSGP